MLPGGMEMQEWAGRNGPAIPANGRGRNGAGPLPTANTWACRGAPPAPWTPSSASKKFAPPLTKKLDAVEKMLEVAKSCKNCDAAAPFLYAHVAPFCRNMTVDHWASGVEREAVRNKVLSFEYEPPLTSYRICAASQPTADTGGRLLENTLACAGSEPVLEAAMEVLLNEKGAGAAASARALDGKVCQA